MQLEPQALNETFNLRIHEVGVVDVGVVARCGHPHERDAFTSSPCSIELLYIDRAVVLPAEQQSRTVKTGDGDGEKRR